MTPVQFVTELFGEGWTEEKLSVFLVMVKQMQEDALRYHHLRDAYAGIDSSQADLRQIDREVDTARQSGLI